MGEVHDVELAYRSSETARVVAATMQALATPSRVRILSRLATGPCSVGELAVDVAMEPSAVSQQLRVLRHLNLVVGDRRGRHVIYALHDCCSHREFPISSGSLMTDGTIECPLHGGAFKIRTGEPTQFPVVVPVETFRVRVVDDMIEIARK